MIIFFTSVKKVNVIFIKSKYSLLPFQDNLVNAKSDCVYYDVEQNLWFPTNSMSVPRFAHAAVATDEGIAMMGIKNN